MDRRFALDIEEKFVTVPARVLQGQDLYTLFTSMFMHAGWFHLLGNMLFLFVFGDNIEDAFGHFTYLGLYILCGLAATFAYITSLVLAPTIYNILPIGISSDLNSGLLGASGAISGVLGAYIVLYPRAGVVTLLFFFALPLPAIVFLGIWFILQWVYGLFDPLSQVAYFAHIGGFIVGMILAQTVGKRKKKAREARLRL